MDILHSKKTIFRLGLVVIVPIAVLLLVPVYGQSGQPRFDLPVAFLVSLTLILLIHQAVEKRRRLLQTINLELNKLSRVYHLSRNLSETDTQRYRGWFTELHGNLYRYLSAFSERDFGYYEETNSEFRELSYHVYKVPELRSSKEEALYDDLLRTVAKVAESRQQIKESKDARMSIYVWMVVLLLVVGLGISAWLSTIDVWTSRLAAGVTLAGFLVMIDLLYEVDTLASEYRPIAQRYVDNIGRIELRRREDE